MTTTPSVLHTYLFQFSCQTLNAVDSDGAVIQDGHNVATIGADCYRGDGVLRRTNVEERLAGVSVKETKHSILAQYA